MVRSIKVDNVDAYSWDCPECGTFNIHDKYCDAICVECSFENEDDSMFEDVDACSWECPECSTFNIHDKYSDMICCNCSEKFELLK